MSRDGDGKPPNPFATSSPGAGNPFEDIMGAAPAAPSAAPNPFAAGPPSAPAGDEPPEAPAITVIRATKSAPNAPAPAQAAPAPAPANDDMMSMLGLDVEERAPPPPPKKAVRPELEEWRSEMAHGGGGVPDEPPNLAAASNPRIQALPPAKKAGAIKYVVIAVVVLVVVAVGGIAQRVLKAGGAEAEAAAGAPLSETDQLLELGLRPENAPDCFTRDKGFHFSYLDSGGKAVEVKSIADVPPLYRMGAKCLPQK